MLFACNFYQQNANFRLGPCHAEIRTWDLNSQADALSIAF